MTNYIRILGCTFLILSLNACWYRKVSVSIKDRRLVAYDRKNPMVFRSNTGLTDTVYFTRYGTRSGFETNFDHWWELHISRSAMPKSRRGLYYSVAASSNFPKNNYTGNNLNMYLILRLVKAEITDSLKLSSDHFNQSYFIQNFKDSDTLFFSCPDAPVFCPSRNCIKK